MEQILFQFAPIIFSIDIFENLALVVIMHLTQLDLAGNKTFVQEMRLSGAGEMPSWHFGSIAVALVGHSLGVWGNGK